MTHELSDHDRETLDLIDGVNDGTVYPPHVKDRVRAVMEARDRCLKLSVESVHALAEARVDLAAAVVARDNAQAASRDVNLIRRAINDPHQFTKRAGDSESLGEWSARAVVAALDGSGVSR